MRNVTLRHECVRLLRKGRRSKEHHTECQSFFVLSPRVLRNPDRISYDQKALRVSLYNQTAVCGGLRPTRARLKTLTFNTSYVVKKLISNLFRRILTNVDYRLVSHTLLRAFLGQQSLHYPESGSSLKYIGVASRGTCAARMLIDLGSSFSLI
jgi:hypothetical protein